MPHARQINVQDERFTGHRAYLLGTVLNRVDATGAGIKESAWKKKGKLRAQYLILGILRLHHGAQPRQQLTLLRDHISQATLLGTSRKHPQPGLKGSNTRQRRRRARHYPVNGHLARPTDRGFGR